MGQGGQWVAYQKGEARAGRAEVRSLGRAEVRGPVAPWGLPCWVSMGESAGLLEKKGLAIDLECACKRPGPTRGELPGRSYGVQRPWTRRAGGMRPPDSQIVASRILHRRSLVRMYNGSESEEETGKVSDERRGMGCLGRVAVAVGRSRARGERDQVVRPLTGLVCTD